MAIENARTYQGLEDLEQAKSDFVFTVAHELKAPVAAIQSILRVLLEGYAGEIFQKQKELIGRAERRLIALQSLIRDLLALGALKGALPDTKKTDVILNGVVNRVVDTIRAEVEEKGIALTVEVPESLLTLKGNDEDLERLLSNLLENAVKYTASKGQVNMQLSGMVTLRLGSRIRVSASRRNPCPTSLKNSIAPRMPKSWARKEPVWVFPWSSILWTGTTGRFRLKANPGGKHFSRLPFRGNKKVRSPGSGFRRKGTVSSTEFLSLRTHQPSELRAL